MQARKIPTWYVVRRGGTADFQRCFEGRDALPFPYISGPYMSRRLAEEAAAKQRHEDMNNYKQARNLEPNEAKREYDHLVETINWTQFHFKVLASTRLEALSIAIARWPSATVTALDQDEEI